MIFSAFLNCKKKQIYKETIMIDKKLQKILMRILNEYYEFSNGSFRILDKNVSVILCIF